MLYEILAIILVIYAVLSPFWVIKAIKFGISCAISAEEAAEEPVFDIPQREEPVKDAVLSMEEQQIVDILANIDAFDGTSRGQKEIKEI